MTDQFKYHYLDGAGWIDTKMTVTRGAYGLTIEIEHSASPTRIWSVTLSPDEAKAFIAWLAGRGDEG